MGFQVTTEQRSVGSGLDGTIHILSDPSSGARAEVWPALGFNCFRWQVPWQGRPVDLLYADPQLFENGRPTRSGIPILFPFPNRIRAGRFAWAGKTYQLPLNDAPNLNAIHGFVCRKAWRVVGQGASVSEAWLSASFRGSVDAPETVALWPADYQITLTYRLQRDRLRLEAVVENPDRVPLPFGLGYHPYFSVPLAPPATEADCLVEVPARSYWELKDNLPTGVRHPVDAGRDLSKPRCIADLKLDDILTDLECQVPVPSDGLCLRGRIVQPYARAQLELLATPVFREMVVFNPAHRQAICLEPYTCPTDAINLSCQGQEAGWLVLQPGERWMETVDARWVGSE